MGSAGRGLGTRGAYGKVARWAGSMNSAKNKKILYDLAELRGGTGGIKKT
jgi:hypothetical protein